MQKKEPFPKSAFQNNTENKYHISRGPFSIENIQAWKGFLDSGLKFAFS